MLVVGCLFCDIILSWLIVHLGGCKCCCSNCISFFFDYLDYLNKDRLTLIFSSNVQKWSLYRKGKINTYFPIFIYYTYSFILALCLFQS